MVATVKLDGSDRLVLSRDLRRAAGILRGQRLRVSATPGRVVLEVEPNPGKVARRKGGKRVITRNPSHFVHTAPELGVVVP